MAVQVNLYQAQLRLARHYVDLMHDIVMTLNQGGDNAFQAVSSFDAERAQIEHWYVWLSQHADQHEEIAHLFMASVQSSDSILTLRIPQPQLLAWRTQGLSFAQRSGDIAAQAYYLRAIGTLCFDTGRLSEAEQYYTQSIELAEQIGDAKHLASALHNLGFMESDQGKFDLSFEHTQRSLELHQEIGDHTGIIHCLRQLGLLCTRMGHWEAAHDYLQAGYSATLRYGNISGIVLSLQLLGTYSRTIGKHDDAIEYLNQGLEFAARVGDQKNYANILGEIAACYDFIGNFSSAQQTYLQALASARQIGARRFEAGILANLGYSAYLQGNFADCVRYSEEALAITRSYNLDFHTAMLLANLIPAYLKLGMLHQAQSALCEGLQHSISIDSPQLKATLLVAAVQTWVILGQSQPEDQHHIMESAAYWSGLILSASVAQQENCDEIHKLIPEMESLLGTERFTALLKQGESLDFDSVIHQVLAVLEEGQ